MTNNDERPKFSQRPWDPFQNDNYHKAPSTTTVNVEEYHQRTDATALNDTYWQPGFVAQFPWIGFGALSLMLTCISLTIVILQTSDTKAQEEWPVPLKWKWVENKWKKPVQLSPSVALAVTNTISNLCLVVAIGQGVVIAWWRQAMKGATVAELQNSWGFSNSPLYLLTAGKNFNVIALAALTAKLALVDNLLLQRAAGTVPGILSQNVTVRVPIAQILPSNYAGAFNQEGTTGYLTGNFSEDIHDYATSGDSIYFDNYPSLNLFDNRCNGTCLVTVPGFGFNVSCSADVISRNYSITQEMAINTTTMVNEGQSMNDDTNLWSLLHVQVNQSLAGVNTTVGGVIPTFSSFTLLSQWASLRPATGPADNTDSDTCIGQWMEHTCRFLPAKVNYPVEITSQNSTTEQLGLHATNAITLAKPDYAPEWNISDPTAAQRNGILTKGQIWGVEVIENIPYDSSIDANIQSINAIIQTMFGGSVYLEYLDGVGYVPSGGKGSTTGPWWGHWAGKYAYRTNAKSCVMDMVDPTTWIIGQVNAIMLRASISTALSRIPDLQSEDTTPGLVTEAEAVQISNTLRYASHYEFMAAAIATMFLCIICVLPSYWGFWQIGRKVTLGPMEIASAFRAPVLDHPNTVGRDADVILRELGQRRVKYGEVNGTGRLGIAEPPLVRPLPMRRYV